MKRISLKAISGVALAIFLVLAAAQIPVSGQGKARRIEGTWRAQVRVLNCQTGAEIVTLSGLNTFLPGGSMISTVAINPALLSTGHGVWEHAGGRSFTNTVISLRFNPDGTYAGTEKVTRNIELDSSGDEFTSINSSEIADPAGNVIRTGCSTVTAHRLE